MNRVEGKVVLISGGTSGIGHALTELLVKNGAFVSVCGLSEENIRITESLDPSGESLLVSRSDVRDQSACRSLVERTLDNFGQLDIVVHSAGVGYLSPFLETSSSDYDRIFDTNVKGLYHLLQSALPTLMEQNRGQVIAVAGILGIKPLANGSVYAGSKYAVVGMCQSLAHELRRYNIKVNVICPSGVDSPFWEGVAGKPRPEILLQPRDVAEAILAMMNLPETVTPNLWVTQHLQHQIWP